MNHIFSTKKELDEIQKILGKYFKLPFVTKTISGDIFECIISEIKDAKVLNTYDFVDVLKIENKVGWQAKSSLSTTPLTWKRVKISNKKELIDNSYKNEIGRKKLGNTILKHCNDHAINSLKKYNLDKIGLARLIVFPDGKVTYYEKVLCDKENQNIFNPDDFKWEWSKPKHSNKKEQLPAFNGIHKKTNKKWFAWYGLGENQFHFIGERTWWNSEDVKSISFKKPEDSISHKYLMKLLCLDLE